MRKFGKTWSLLLTAMLLINLLLPATSASAAGELENPVITEAEQSVADGNTVGDEGTTVEGTPGGETTVEGNPGEETLVEGTPGEETPVEGNSGEETLVEEILGEGATGETATDEKDKETPSTEAQVITRNLITSVVMKDKDGNLIETVRPDQGSKVQIDFTWELPAEHGYKDGATFTFSLPDKFVSEEITGDLDGGYGTFNVSPEGLVTLTFNEAIEDNDALDGYFFVWRYFDERKLEGGTQQEVIIEFNDEVIENIPVHFKSKDTSEIDKSGTANKGRNADNITWTVDFNKGEKEITEALFKDVLHSGLEIDMDSIVVHELEVQLNGSEPKVISQEDPYTRYTKLKATDGTNGFELKFDDIIKNAFRVTYTTKITGTVDDTYNNNVTVSGTGLSKDLVDSAGVWIEYSKPISKESDGYDPATQTINWKIEYNYNEQSIDQSVAWIEDSFDKTHQQLVEGSFKVSEMKIDNNGNASPTVTEVTYGEDYTVAGTDYGFKLNFAKNISSAYEITYQTKAINRVTDDSSTVNNIAVIDGGKKDDADQTIGQVIFHKDAVGVDYKKKEISWKIDLNLDKHEMKNVVITDNFKEQGLTLVEDSVSITGLTKDTDYTVAPDPDYNTGFKITIEPTVTIKDSHEITYKTKFDPTYYTPDQIKTIKYNNKAELKWDDKDGKPQTPIVDKTATVDPDDYTKHNGNKTGSYNAKTNEITWEINVNYNLHEIKKPVFRDFYTGKQKFVDGSLAVYPLTLTGGKNGVEVSAGTEPLVPEVDYTYEPKTDKDGNDGFELKFNKEINSAYRITYKTSLDGLPVEKIYKNKATLHDEEGKPENLFEKSATVETKYGDEYVNKTGKQGSGADAEYAYWTVNINRNQSYVEAGSKLTDTLSANQILDPDPDSFNLYGTTIAEDGTVTRAELVDKENYTLAVDGNTFTLTFKNELRTAYILEYKSFINADDGETISNRVTFAGQSSGTVETSENGKIDVRFAGAGGGANTPGKGDLTIVKVDAKTGEALSGAKFGLYDKSGTTLLKAVEVGTDSDGKAVFENFKYKEYMIKELSAPIGYVIADEYKNGKVIEFNKEATEFKISNEKGNWDFELMKVDRDDETKRLAGAVFKLQFDKGDGQFRDVAGKTNLETNEQGKIYLSDLLVGNYQLIEVKAPKGYKLDQTPTKFTIDSNQTMPKTFTMKNEIYVGSVELSKVDAHTGITLPGAEFELLNAEGRNVLESEVLRTDKDGKLLIDNLKAGSYQLVEVKAPEGYLLNTEPLPIEIVDDKKLQVEFENTPETGSVKLIKIEQDRPTITLPGAEFRVLDANKEPAKNSKGEELAELITDSNGELQIPNLLPGRYFIEETRAPYGFSIKDKLTEIEVISGKETVVTVENIRIPVTGGGENNPNPPANPDPEKPVNPDPVKPVDPVDPIDPVDPTNPTDPEGEPTDGTDPQIPTEEGTNSGGKNNAGGKDNTGKNTNQGNKPVNGGNGKSPTEGTKPQNPSGNVLPKTGEDSPLPLQLAGFGSIIMGLALLVYRKKQALQK